MPTRSSRVATSTHVAHSWSSTTEAKPPSSASARADDPNGCELKTLDYVTSDLADDGIAPDIHRPVGGIRRKTSHQTGSS